MSNFKQALPPFEPMRLAVIGAGWLGGTVGRNWHRAGHEVAFSTRHPERLAAMVRKLGDRAQACSVREAAAFGDVVLLATPYVELPAVARDLSDLLVGKLLLDACNPPPSQTEPLSIEAARTGVGAITARLFPRSRVVRCFSAVDATDIEASYDRRTGKLGTPIAGDNPEAVAMAVRLSIDAGCDPLVVGSLTDGRCFERGSAGFRANTTLAELQRRLGMV